ncbi:cylicin-1 [Oryzias melastigma]|uniref:cylicin-1 n=1 Tax=Oryzias melastigma TaxID=30732 RepID=UPI000CF7C1E9|nr:cylicin-1 [Oryzias melastigma]
MKLGLLLALAVAAFVPHLSESRIISRCELKQKLQQALTVTKANGKNYDQIIALVSCEVERRSHLDSSLVMGNAERPPLPVTPTAQVAAGNETVAGAGTSSTTSAAAVSTGVALNSTAGGLRRKREARFEGKRNGKWSRNDDEEGKDDNSDDDSDSSNDESTDEDEENSEDSEDNSSEDEENNEESDETSVGHGSQENVTQAAMIPTVATDTTGMSNSTAGSLRRKRDAPSRKEHKKKGKKDNKKENDSSEENHAGKHSQESSSTSGEGHEKVTGGGIRSSTSKPTTSAASFSATGTAAVSGSTSAGLRKKREARFRRSPDRRDGKEERSEEEESKEEKGGKGGKQNHKPSEGGSHQQGTVKPTLSAASVHATASAFASPSAAIPTGTPGALRRRRRASSMEKNKDDDKGDKSKESKEASEEEHSNGSVSFYGLFQLSSSLCDLGNNGSKNECGKKCSAFIDGDITDDVECFVDSGYWRSVLRDISSICFKQMDSYFAQCQ